MRRFNLNQTKEFDRHERVSFSLPPLRSRKDGGGKADEGKGHHKIACIVRPGGSFHTGKDTGWLYRATICRFTPAWSYEGESLEAVEKYGIRQCLTEEVTAVICGSPDIACCVWKLMERTRMPVPDALSMIVVGDSPVLKLLGRRDYSSPASGRPDGQKCGRVSDGDDSGAERDGTDAEVFLRKLQSAGAIVHPAQEKLGEKIIVVGSMNMDVTLEASRIPVKGETQLAGKAVCLSGRKRSQSGGRSREAGRAGIYDRLSGKRYGRQRTLYESD